MDIIDLAACSSTCSSPSAGEHGCATASSIPDEPCSSSSISDEEQQDDVVFYMYHFKVCKTAVGTIFVGLSRTARSKTAAKLQQQTISALSTPVDLACGRLCCGWSQATYNWFCVTLRRIMFDAAACLQVLPCCNPEVHDCQDCPYAHPSEKATRRDPRIHRYTGVSCPSYRKVCPTGFAAAFLVLMHLNICVNLSIHCFDLNSLTL